jgi:N-acetylated-alpha-linked acidic dipeptidase
MWKYSLCTIFVVSFCIQTHSQSIDGFFVSAQQAQLETEEALRQNIDKDIFKQHLHYICKKPHVGGTNEAHEIADYIGNQMKNYGLEVSVHPYDVYLPESPGEANAWLVRPIRLPLNNQEYIIEEDPYSDGSQGNHGWNAWSGSGDVTGNVVYVNYGTKSDFDKLKTEGIEVNGKIAIARYGGNFRGYKAKFAEEAGAIALIIYTDPKDSGFTRGPVYPEGTWYTESSIQRGSLGTLDYVGDALTPGFPALASESGVPVERIPVDNITFPEIPVLPLSYGAATEILSRMTGPPVFNQEWQGGLPFTYRIEGGDQLEVRVKVNQARELRRINNVVGRITGSEFPDEWIILGCHYDAWTFGATDPNSGTALMLSLAANLQKLEHQGYKPKRSILFAHWDAEEFGLIGSTEWVEHFLDELQIKSVCYINLDGAVSGPNFGASASPSLKKIIADVAKTVDYPSKNMSLFDAWKANKSEDPDPGSLGGGSDHVAFYMYGCIPSMSAGMGGPTLYHTNYDNLYFYEKFANPDYNYHPIIEEWLGKVTLRLANADIVPFHVSKYYLDLLKHFNKASEEVLKKHAIKRKFVFPETEKQLIQLQKATEKYYKTLARFSSSSGSYDQKTEVNQILINLEKNFQYLDGMQFSNWYKSLYASTDPYSGYASWLLPPIQYMIENEEFDEIDAWDAVYGSAIAALSADILRLCRSIDKM